MKKNTRETNPTSSGGILFIDPKSGSVTEGLQEYANKYGMSFKVWTLCAMVGTHTGQYSPNQ